MKKSLFAIAAVTAFAGAAQAQSSVTVYGILDVGYIGVNQRQQVGSVSTKATTNTFGSSAEQSSRLGFKGSEDLGGGTSAFFTVETGMNADNSTVSAWNTRQAFVGLKKNGIGNFAFGTQYTPVHAAVCATDQGNCNNMAGNVIFATTPGANGNTQGVAALGTTSSAQNGQTDAYTVRTSNTLTATSDTFAGFNATALYTLNNVNTTQTATTGTSTTSGGNTNNSGWGLGVNYTWQKLYATANYQAFKSVNPYLSTTGSTAAAVYSQAGSPLLYGITGGSNINDQQAYAAATYDFGVLKAALQWVNRKATSAVNTGYYVKRNAQQLGVSSYITPTIQGFASIGNGKVNAFGTGEPSASFTAWQAGANYYLSKRTNLYAIYGQNQASNVTSVAGVNSSFGISNYALGVRHTF